MCLKTKAIYRRHIAGSVILAGLGVIGWLYCETLQLKDRSGIAAPAAAASGIADIAKQFSFASNAPLDAAPRIVTLKAEDFSIPAEEQAGLISAEEPETIRAPREQVAAYILNQPFSRHTGSWQSILSFRSSLPTFDQMHTTVQSRNLLASAAARYLDTPFNALFENVFARTTEEASRTAESSQKQAMRNPFTEAKREVEASVQPQAAATPPAPAASNETTSASNADAKSSPPPVQQPAVGDGNPKPVVPEGPFLVLGDFTGSGTVEAWSAARVDDGTFAFKDGQRTFGLTVNPEAVDFQRSFAIDDVNGDGIPDLIATSRAALAGGILLGDGNGNYRLSDSFMTGFEPIVPVPGRMGDQAREILGVNVRTGSIQTFRRADASGYRQVRNQAAINFLPHFLARITKIDSGRDVFMAAQSGQAARVWQWQEDGSLAFADESIPPAPSVSIFKTFPADGALSNLQVYQIGSSASVLLINGQGAAHNVANFRVSPQIFLVIGDLLRRGKLDVAAAFLLSAAPSK